MIGSFRRLFVRGSTITQQNVAGRGSPGSPSVTPSSRLITIKPNIIVIMPDDIGYSDIGC